MASHLRSVHRRAKALVWVCGLLLGGACAAALLLHLRADRAEVPKLSGPGTPLAEALGWPWPDFPSVTDIEREEVRRELRIDEPLLAADVRPWTVVPESGMFGYPRRGEGRARELVLESVEILKELDIGREQASRRQSEWRMNRADFDRALAGLSSAITVDSARWLPRYNRGVLYLWNENGVGAERELLAALNLLRPFIDERQKLERLDSTSRRRVLEAAIHTYYALGTALSVSSGDDSPERHERAIEHFRESVLKAGSLIRYQAQDYPAVPNRMASFPVRPSGIDSWLLRGDHITSYLKDPSYHYCDEPPTAKPDCETLRRDPTAECNYRDRIFCLSLARVAEPFARPYRQLFDRFYGSSTFAEGVESQLWTLSNYVDLASEDPRLTNNPYLLYNSGVLLVSLGELDLAAQQLGEAVAALEVSRVEVPAQHRERMHRIAIVVGVLARERTPLSFADSGDRVSLYRSTFDRLYGAETPAPFPPVSRYFPERDQESLIDRWLFIHLWRGWLEEGRFEHFSGEYQRFIESEDVFKDFFGQWKDSVLTAMGERALERVEKHRASGQSDKAEMILGFIRDSGHFPDAIVKEARVQGGWLWRRVGSIVLVLLLAVLPLVAVIYLRGLVALHKLTFFSVHRKARLSGFTNAYPSGRPARASNPSKSLFDD